MLSLLGLAEGILFIDDLFQAANTHWASAQVLYLKNVRAKSNQENPQAAVVAMHSSSQAYLRMSSVQSYR